MPYHGSHKDEIERSANELAKSGKHFLAGEEFKRDIQYVAKTLKLDLTKPYDIQKVRKILGKGTPISDIVSEMRNEQC
ncbi:MAG: hypothetical protein ACRD38_00040 [Nitrososphaerales archaeon]